MIDQKKLWNVEYLNCLITRYARRAHEIKSMISTTRATFKKKKKKKTSFQKTGLKFTKKLVKYYIWSIALYGAETRTFRKVDHKFFESFEKW